MAFQPSIIDHPELPGAVLVSTPDGGNLTVPRDRLPQLGLAQAGATAQNDYLQQGIDFVNSQPPATIARDFSAPLDVRGLNLGQAKDITGVKPQAPVIPPSVTATQRDFAGQFGINSAVPQLKIAPQQAPKIEARQSAPQAPAGPEYLGGGRRRLPDGQVQVYQAGSPAFNPEQYNSSLREVKQGKATKVEGAHEFDPGAVEQYQEWERKAAETKAKADVLAAQNDARTQAAMGVELEKITAQQQAELAASEDRYRTRLTSLESEAKQVASRQVNPNRVAQGMNWFQKLGFILASAFSGGATKGQRNIPLEQFHDLVNSDVAAQEQEIARSKGVVDNALSRLSQEWGSIQAGKSALRVQQFEVAKQRIQTLAAQTNTSVAQVRAQAAVEALAAAQAKDFEQLRVASMGQRSETTQSAYMAPRAAQGGGWRYETLGEESKRLDVEKKRQELSGDYLDNNAAQRKEHLGKGLSEVAVLRTNVDQIISRSGITEDKEGNAHHKGIPGVGYGYNFIEALAGKPVADALASAVGGPDAATIRNQASEALTNKIKEASGAAFSEAEAERHARALGQSLSQGEDAFAQAMVNFRRALDAKESALRAGAGTKASRSYDQDRQQLEYETSAARQGVLGTYQGTVTK